MSDNRTTELREKLTERGVEYVIGYNQKGTSAVETTYFEHDGKSVEFMAWVDADHTKLTAYDLTPEQAIAATLGRGTLTAEQVRECVQHVYHEGYSDGSVRRGAHIDETDWQAIADELNAHVGRTCEACAFSKPTDLTDGCAALERIAELEEECDQLRKAVAYWQRMYEEQIGVRR